MFVYAPGAMDIQERVGYINTAASKQHRFDVIAAACNALNELLVKPQLSAIDKMAFAGFCYQLGQAQWLESRGLRRKNLFQGGARLMAAFKPLSDFRDNVRHPAPGVTWQDQLQKLLQDITCDVMGSLQKAVEPMLQAKHLLNAQLQNTGVNDHAADAQTDDDSHVRALLAEMMVQNILELLFHNKRAEDKYIEIFFKEVSKLPLKSQQDYVYGMLITLLINEDLWLLDEANLASLKRHQLIFQTNDISTAIGHVYKHNPSTDRVFLLGFFKLSQKLGWFGTPYEVLDDLLLLLLSWNGDSDRPSAADVISMLEAILQVLIQTEYKNTGKVFKLWTRLYPFAFSQEDVFDDVHRLFFKLFMQHCDVVRSPECSKHLQEIFSLFGEKFRQELALTLLDDMFAMSPDFTTDKRCALFTLLMPCASNINIQQYQRTLPNGDIDIRYDWSTLPTVFLKKILASPGVINYLNWVLSIPDLANTDTDPFYLLTSTWHDIVQSSQLTRLGHTREEHRVAVNQLSKLRENVQEKIWMLWKALEGNRLNFYMEFVLQKRYEVIAVILDKQSAEEILELHGCLVDYVASRDGKLTLKDCPQELQELMGYLTGLHKLKKRNRAITPRRWAQLKKYIASFKLKVNSDFAQFWIGLKKAEGLRFVDSAGGGGAKLDEALMASAAKESEWMPGVPRRCKATHHSKLPIIWESQDQVVEAEVMPSYFCFTAGKPPTALLWNDVEAELTEIETLNCEEGYQVVRCSSA
jgi:hypothetical protein